ncbi:MAG: hypothetical protein QOD92_269 [Acidimicrobiaceae bacterium]
MVVGIVVGIVVAGVHALSSPDDNRVTAAAPPTTKPAPLVTTTAPPATTAELPTTTVTEPPAPTSTVPRKKAPPTTKPPPTTEPPTTEPPPPPTTAAPLPELAIYGDSLMAPAWARYQEITASERDTHGHWFAGAALPNWSASIQGDTVNRLVLALGTNDADRDGAKPWADLLDALPETKCIVWPKTYEGSDAVKVFNADLSTIVAAHPNVHVIDWDAAVKAHPEWVQSDQRHYTDEGSNQYAAMLKQAALTCP